MKLIKQIHDLISLAIDKGYTQYVTDSQIDDGIHMAQMVLWRDLVKEFPKNKRVRNDLLPFEVKADITVTPTATLPSSGIGPLPTDFEQEIEMWANIGGTLYPIQIIESGFFKRRIRDVVDPPNVSSASTINLFATIYNDTGNKIEVAPSTTPVTILYFKKPTKPIYATTGPTNGQYIYSDSGSTDVLWSDTMSDILVERSLAIYGLNMRDGQVQRAGQPPVPKELTI